MSSMSGAIEDKLYEGYNDYHSAFNTKNIDQDVFLQEAILKSSYGRRTRVPTGFRTPGTGMRLGTSSGFKDANGMPFRPVTGRTDTGQRPMTAVSGAGYTSQRRGPSGFILGTVSSSMSRSDYQEERCRRRYYLK